MWWLATNGFYFLFGVSFCMFVGVLLNKRKKSDYITEPLVWNSRVYLNVFFLNRKEVLENIVRSKVSKSRWVIRALAKRLAVNMVSDERLVERVGQDLKGTIPVRLQIMGIRASAAVVYQQSAYICVEVNLMSVDLLHMLKMNAGSDKAHAFERFVDSFFVPGLMHWLETFAVRLVAGKVLQMLPQVIKEKLQDKLIADVEIVTLTDSEQGPFMVQTIQQLNVAKQASLVVDESAN